jgi:hypothetical protein
MTHRDYVLYVGLLPEIREEAFRTYLLLAAVIAGSLHWPSSTTPFFMEEGTFDPAHRLDILTMTARSMLSIICLILVHAFTNWGRFPSCMNCVVLYVVDS